jgi:hypothetical protein
MKHLEALYSDKANEGLAAADAVYELKQQGATIAESIKILFRCYKLPLATAKSIVCAHPVWLEESQKADQLHEELLVYVDCADHVASKQSPPS